MEEAGELWGLRMTHQRPGGAETRQRKQSELKTSNRVFPTAFSPSTTSHARRLTTREAGSARRGTWDVCEWWGGEVAV